MAFISYLSSYFSLKFDFTFETIIVKRFDLLEELAPTNATPVPIPRLKVLCVSLMCTQDSTPGWQRSWTEYTFDKRQVEKMMTTFFEENLSERWEQALQ